jgi:hypothetical protein
MPSPPGAGRLEAGRRLAALLLLGIPACAGRPAEGSAPLNCPAFAPQGATSYDPFSVIAAPSLAGEFDLVSVLASDGPPGYAWRGVLRLVATDSAFRPLRSSTSENAPWLAGTLEWRSQAGDSLVQRDTVQAVSEWLYVGCRRCMDASPLEYRIIAVTPREFWGYWQDPQTGISTAMDASGRRLPDPAGHYCARRRGGA